MSRFLILAYSFTSDIRLMRDLNFVILLNQKNFKVMLLLFNLLGSYLSAIADLYIVPCFFYRVKYFL